MHNNEVIVGKAILLPTEEKITGLYVTLTDGTFTRSDKFTKEDDITQRYKLYLVKKQVVIAEFAFNEYDNIEIDSKVTTRIVTKLRNAEVGDKIRLVKIPLGVFSELNGDCKDLTATIVSKDKGNYIVKLDCIDIKFIAKRCFFVNLTRPDSFKLAFTF